MGKHEAPEPKHSARRRLVTYALHSAFDVATLIALHIAALGLIEHGSPVLEKSQLLLVSLIH